MAEKSALLRAHKRFGFVQLQGRAERVGEGRDRNGGPGRMGGMPQQQEETEQTRVLSPVLGADSRLGVMKV